MRSLTSADDLRPWFRPGAEIFVAGCLGESQRFIEWLKSRPTLADGVRFTGVLIPGANRFDYAGLHPNARMRTVFASPDWSGPATAARHECLPLGYRDAYAWLSRQRFDAVLVQGAPDGSGLSLSAAADFTPAALQHAGAVIAHRNARLPVTDAPRIRAPDAVLDADSDLPAYDAGPIGDTMRKLALNVLRLIEPGATLQLGLGKLQSALLAALPPGRELRVHSGMVSSPIVDAIARGVFAQDKAAIVCGVALGDRRLLERSPDFHFRSVDFTHDPRTLASIARFVSINSILEIDLYGQVNAEYLEGRPISGCGGLVDFVRGARLAGGTSVLALNATARSGASRIVPRLRVPTVSVSRYDVDVVVSEYGVARLAGSAGDERAQRLIAIAAPDHRDALYRQWQSLDKFGSE